MKQDNRPGLPSQALQCAARLPPFSPAALDRLHRAQTFARQANRLIRGGWGRPAPRQQRHSAPPAHPIATDYAQASAMEAAAPLENRLYALFAD